LLSPFEKLAAGSRRYTNRTSHRRGIRMVRSLAACLVLYICFDLFSSHASAADQTYDVVIYGGNAGGVAAAVQAARMGKSVLIIEPGKHIGGLTSCGWGATDI